MSRHRSEQRRQRRCIVVTATAVGADGSWVITGSFFCQVDFDPTLGADLHATVGSSDVFVTKLATDGTYVWTRTWGGADDDFANAVAVGSDGSVAVVGGTRGTVDFDPGAGTDLLGSWTYDDAFVIKYLP